VSGAWDRPVQRAVRLLLGLALFGVAMAVLVEADLGLDPWNVFNQGVAGRVGLSLGTVTVIASIVLMALWIPLGERPGVGTVANALLVGPALDFGLAVVPAASGAPAQVAYMLAAILAMAVATGLYVGAGWGPGPRDGLMTGLAAKGVPIARARAGIELTALGVGWLLGGSVGIATVLFATSIGPLVKHALRLLSLPARSGEPLEGADHQIPEARGVELEGHAGVGLPVEAAEQVDHGGPARPAALRLDGDECLL
jgi:uncharacterized membrane protein YczE